MTDREKASKGREQHKNFAERNREVSDNFTVLSVVILSIVCGIYGPSWLKETWVAQWLGNPFGVVCYMLLCSFGALGIMLSSGKFRWPFISVICSLLLYIPLTAAYLLDFRWEALLPVGVCVIAAVSMLSIILPPRPAPLRKPGEDYLGRRLLYISTGAEIRRLLKEKAGGGVSVLVSGPWGIGKSHFISFLVYTLLPQAEKWLGRSLFAQDPQPEEDIEFVATSVDVWKSATNGPMSMWQDVADALTSAISGKSPEGKNKWRENLFQLLRLINIPTPTFAEDVLSMVTSGAGGNISHASAISKRIRESGKRYILVLDNLDRCDKRKRESLFPLIEQLKQIEGLVTICGFSIEGALKKNPQSNDQGALLKIFDISITIPPAEKKYMDAYMAHLVDAYGENGCPHFRSWMRRQCLPFTTPREIETVVRSLCYLERNYLSFLPQSVDFFASITIPLADVIFYVEVLRRLFPEWAMKLAASDKTVELLERWCHVIERDKSKGKTRDGEVAADNAIGPKGLSENEWKELRDNALLGKLILILNKCEESYLSAAINQTYLHVKTAIDPICRQVLEVFRTEHHREPLSAILSFFGSAINDKVEAVPIYADILAYAYTQMQDSDIDYIRACIEQDIQREGSPYAEMYLKSSELILRMLNVRYAKHLAEVADSPWLAVATPMELNFTLHAWNAALRLLGAYWSDAYEQTDSTHASALFAALHQHVDARERMKYDHRAGELYSNSLSELSPILSYALGGYAERICKAILFERFNAVETCIPMDDFPADALAWLEQGVKQYVEKHSPEWGDVETLEKMLASALYAYDTRVSMQEEENEPILLLALSFVTVWIALHRAIFAQGSALSASHRMDLLRYKGRLAQDPPTPKDVKNYNREDAKAAMKKYLGTLHLGI